MADLLTLARVGCAVLVTATTAAGAFTASSVLIAVAWLTDVADGRMARASGDSRLGRWDPIADALVGAGVAIGLALGGLLPGWLVLGAVIGLGGLLVIGNLAAGMLLQLTGYLPLLWWLWTERPNAWWLPFMTAFTIGVLDRKRLLYVNIPNFFHGMAGRFDRSH